MTESRRGRSRGPQRTVLAGLLVSALFAPPSALRAQTPGPSGERATAVVDAGGLRAGDAVRITVWRRAELSGEFEIGADGSIRHPLYRSVYVHDISLAELDDRLRLFLSGLDANPQFIVEPLFRITVAGEVRQPNVYRLAPEVTLMQAIAGAGGPTERGRSDRVRVVRDGRHSTIDLSGADLLSAHLRVQSGDQIIVERRRSMLREHVVPFATVIGAAAALVTAISRLN